MKRKIEKAQGFYEEAGRELDAMGGLSSDNV